MVAARNRSTARAVSFRNLRYGRPWRELVVAEDEHITRLSQEFDQLALEIDDEILVRAEHTKPLDLVELEHVPTEES